MNTLNTMTTMNPIEIRNLKGEVLFTHRTEYNTILKTLNKAVTDGVKLQGADLTDTDLTGADLRGADLRGAKYTQEQIDCAITDKTTIF